MQREMASQTLKRVKNLWETWDIRVLMLASLGIQILLTVLAPQRKRCVKGIFKLCMWLLYLLADAVALYTIGLISSNKDDTPNDVRVCEPAADHQGRSTDLLAFWSSFLLLHLGGPDTITALALQDNELWHRHALQLATQVAVTIYVILRSFRRNTLLLPTVLMFIDGLIKYTERTFALYIASMENFRDSQRSHPESGPNYARLMEEYSSATEADIPTEIRGRREEHEYGASVLNYSKFRHDSSGGSADEQSISGTDDGSLEADDQGIAGLVDTTTATATWHLNDPEVTAVREAYQFFEKFKGLLADSFLSLEDRNDSRGFFLAKATQDAFRIIEIELNFIYDVFYTKVFLLRRKGSFARIICFPSVMVSLLLLTLKDKSNYKHVDIGITFALLGGAIALDIFSTLMFVLSDWWIIVASWSSRPRCLASHILWLRRWCGCWRLVRFRHWSQSISQYNLLTRCLEGSRFFDWIRIRKVKEFFAGCLCVDRNKVDQEFVNFIVAELQKKSRLATDIKATKEICGARGNLIFEDDCFLISECLRPWTIDVDYDESLLIWHFATELCHQTSSTDPDKLYKDNKYCKFSKLLSDYMSYLVLMQQELVSPVVGASDIRFGDTREEAKKFIQNSMMLQNLKCNKKRFCEKVLGVKAEVQPIIAKGDKSKSVLFDACRLAKQLKMFGEAQWVIMSKVWMELLAYAAIRCSPRSHVAQLCKEGELITIVWLLMAHLGLGEQFRQNQGFGLTKLIIHK